MTRPGLVLRVAVAIATVVVAGGPARGETLTDAWALALQQDHSLAAVRNQAEAAGFEAQAARAQRWPTVVVDGLFALAYYVLNI